MKNQKDKRAGIYVRVSTGRQQTDSQENELVEYAERRDWKVYRVYRDKGFSGSQPERPALSELIQDCRMRKLDVVLVWKFDRFARSLKHLVSALDEFKKLKVDFVSLTEAVDTSIPSGELIFQIFGAIAQFERSLIGERVRAALAYRRKNGKRIGRPPLRVLDACQLEGLRRDRKRNGLSFRQLAAKYGVSVWTAHRLVSAAPA